MAVNMGKSPIDASTLAGQVRLLVGDTDAKPLNPAVPGFGEYAWYSDTELEALGELNGGSPKRTAIWVLSQVAISQALLLKKWTSEDLQVDGPAITAAIEKTIARLSREVAAEDAVLEGWFDLVGGEGEPCLRRPEGSAYPYPWPYL